MTTGPNKAMESTASRRYDLLFVTSDPNPAANRALARGDSSCALGRMNNVTFSWETIRDKITREPDSPISTLIQHVLASGLSDYLFPATMLRNLRVGRTENFSRADGELTIEYNEADDKVVFHYYDSDRAKPWTKECRGSEISSTFDHIVTKRLRWLNLKA